MVKRRRIIKRRPLPVQCMDCREGMAEMEAESVDFIVTDPPYGLEFMGKGWDKGVPGVEFWEAALRVCKPGAMMLAFGGTRTHHRLMCAIEDAGWEIRDCLMWLYGCLSEDTEILVDGRWEPYNKALTGRLALCYNNVRDEYSWQEIEALYVYDYDDTAFRIQSDSTDQIVSRNHRCLVEQGGAFVFQLAEEAARKRQVRVPVLEDVQGLLQAFPLSHEGAGGTEQDMRESVCGKSDNGSAARETNGEAERDLRCVRKAVSPCAEPPCASSKTDLLPKVQREVARGRMGQARTQRTCRVDGNINGVLQEKDDGAKQSCMEGRGDVLQEARELSGDQVCQMPAGIPGDGPQGRLRDGAQTSCSASIRAMSTTGRDGPSHESQATGQPALQPSTVQKQPGPQTVRGTRHTRTDLARISPFHYVGKVWCVKVPTGAFVARRNGKVFVTGNSGFPKSHDISKAIDKAAGAERAVVGQGKYADRGRKGNLPVGATTDPNNKRLGPSHEAVVTAPATDAAKLWDGWGTALKPAWEPIILAMKPLDGTYAANAQEHGVAGLNVDGGRIKIADGDGGNFREDRGQSNGCNWGSQGSTPKPSISTRCQAGRWPANLILDEEAGAMLDEQSGECPGSHPQVPTHSSNAAFGGGRYDSDSCYGDTGGASRFFYCAKASKAERNAGLPAGTKNGHPTVKPLKLMRYLLTLLSSPTGGLVLDPFAGSGSTGVACVLEDRPFLGFEKDQESCDIANDRIQNARSK
ncbi:MAG: hypothetical protein JRL30_01350 [Deltaproteobacteria bacterium]|nr:hypothetical protein [Deltaproteobacteria bacterium]